MTANLNRGSAKIYEFPARGRFAQSDRCENDKAVTSPLSPRATKVVLSGAWYHDEAIQQAEQLRRS